MLTESKSLNEQSRTRLNSLLPRCILLLLACISVIFFTVTIVLLNSKSGLEDLRFDYWGEDLALASVLPSLCWTSFCLIRRRFSTSQLQTGCLLTLDLISFLVIVTGCSLATQSSTFWSDGQECLVFESDASDGHVSPSCARLIHQVWGLETTAYAAAYSSAIVHIVMFALACRVTHLYNRVMMRRNEAGKQIELPAYPFDNESQEAIVGNSSPRQVDTRKSQSSGGDCAWLAAVGSSCQDHSCAAELRCGT